MVLWKALEMWKTKIMRPSAEAIDMIMRREWMSATGA